MFHKDPRNLYLAKELEWFPWLEHGFGTRDSVPWPDSWKQVALRQIHSNRCVVVSGETGCIGQGDALLTNRPGYLLQVRGADCLPILIIGARPRMVAAVHAGWRGTAAGIVVRTVKRLVSDFGADPQFLHAAIGPGIGPCCYEVGPEVAGQFRELFPERDDLEGKTRLDLAEANRRQLLEAGLSDDRVYRGAPCTACHPEEFHSYRRSPAKGGRMVSAVGILGD